MREQAGEASGEPEAIRVNPGQGKAGRANASEPSLRLRNRKVAATPMAIAAMSGHGTGFCPEPAHGHPGPAVEKAPAPVAPLQMRNAATPLRSGRRASRPDDLRKDGPSRSGNRMAQEANATGPKARGRHNPVDRASWPAPKGG